ncbi:MAG: IPT/TIG domain-containing protein [Planctomycetes bacterium]|nr:IPT/TIG domain-containing protein [Planctomycetota bacterium]
MNLVFRPLGVAAGLWLAAHAPAQGFDYPNFASLGGLTLNGSAAQVGTNLRLTTGGSAQTGSCWRTLPVKVTEGFETQFDFLLTASPEGLAFVIQGSPAGAAALGGGLWGIGYGFGATTNPITNSIAFEIDAIQNGFLNDTSGNEVSIHTVGAFGNSENESVSIGRVTPAADLSSNTVYRLRIRYVPGQLDVFLGSQPAPLLSVPFTFEAGGTQLTGGSTGGLGLAGTDAWVGFTSSTSSGSTGQFAEIRSWSWVSYSLPDACYVGNVQEGAGGPHDLLTIDGTNGGFFRTARAAVADPFTLAVAAPPGQVSAPFLLFLFPGIAGPATVTPTAWGDACFPLWFPIDLGGAIAPVSVPVPAGLILPTELTFQALMATDAANPATIERTNAIGLQLSLAPAPSITTVSPSSAGVGANIVVTGNSFSPFATLDLNGVPVPTTSVAAQQIVFPMPAAVPCGALLRVRNPDGATATATFNPTPTISSTVNNTGSTAGGTVFVVLGTGFAAGTTATIGGNPATVTSVTTGAVVMTTPPGTPGAKQVVVQTPGGCTATTTFTYF